MEYLLKCPHCGYELEDDWGEDEKVQIRGTKDFYFTNRHTAAIIGEHNA